MNYTFTKTDDGVITDKKVQAAVAKLDKLEARGTLTIQAGYEGDHNAYCKISGSSIKPVSTNGKKVGEAVNEAVKKVCQIIRNDKKTVVDKKEHARKKASAVEEEEETFEM